eukprot:5293056-Prorocentrum_lima.AAC.1
MACPILDPTFRVGPRHTPETILGTSFRGLSGDNLPGMYARTQPKGNNVPWYGGPNRFDHGD